jgi:hypothetical protein
MGAFQTQLAVATHRVNGGRSFQLLTGHDSQKLEAFFLAMSFDQRRACFGGGMSDEAIVTFCRRLDWQRVTVVARMGPYCPEAVAMVYPLDDEADAAELSIACPLDCDRTAIIRTLIVLAISAASPFYRMLIVQRELTPSDVVRALLDIAAGNGASGDIIIIKLR